MSIETLTKSEPESVLNLIASALEKSAIPNRLWDLDDIAVYIGCSKSMVYQLKDQSDFPKPCVMKTRFIPQEIMDWAKKKRK